MFRKTQVCTGVLLALSGALLAPSADAQSSGERVEITGSRIKTIQTEGASPVVTLSAETIKVEAVRNMETLLNNLPQVFADFGASVSNGATGTATVNLRNLGANRTLVLINGRRVPAGSPRSIAADLNQIPVSLVRRVEVLTGGASAVYGADAVAGVVNFIMNDRFEGVELELNHQFYNHKQQNPSDVVAALERRNFPVPGNKSRDGEVTDFGITVGGNFAGGKGNATAYLGYKKEEALLQSERDFSACSLQTGAAAGAPPRTRFNCGGSSTSFPGRFFTNTDDGNGYTVGPDGTAIPFLSGPGLYNFGPLNYFQRPSERFTTAAFLRYDISDKARVYLETSFHDDSTVAQIAPSGLFGFDASGANAIRFENPLLSTSWRTALELTGPGTTGDALIFRRNVEGGGRQDDIRHTSFRFVAGVKGDIGPVSYDFFAQTGKVIFQNSYLNDFSIVRSARALDVITDPATGQPACRSAVDGTDPNCVPYNIWRLGGVTQAALDYLQTPGFQRGFTAQNVIGGNVAIDLGSFGVKLPTAEGGVGVVLGVERRTEKLDLKTDTAFSTGDLAGQGGPTIGVGGAYSVRDIFTELRVPLVEKKPGVDLLNLNVSYRNSDYSTGTKSDTWGVGMEYAPIRQAKLRGTMQRAVRAPNVVDLFSARSLGLYNANNDPCAGAVDPATGRTLAGGRTLAECARTGVTAAQFGTILDNPAQQYNAIFGGNPRLNPETSDSVSLGLVLSPIRDLDITIDYFKVEVQDGIGTVPPTDTLTQCLTTGNPLFCGKIKRDSRGTLWATPQAFIEADNANLGTTITEGVDLGANFRMALGGMGRLDLSFIGTALSKLEYEPVPGLGKYDCAGYWGSAKCGTPAPKWRHKLRTTWYTPFNVDVSLTWRHIGKVSEEVTSSDPDLAAAVSPIQANWSAVNYFDISAKYDLTKALSVRVGVTNLLDKDPPIGVTGAPFGNGNTFPVVYDALGRKISLNLTAKF